MRMWRTPAGLYLSSHLMFGGPQELLNFDFLLAEDEEGRAKIHAASPARDAGVLLGA